MLARTLFCSLALIAASQPAAAQVDLSEAEMEVFARAAMPAALASLKTKCDPVLDPDAYMFARSDALQRRLVAASDAAWPSALRVVSRVAGRSNPAMGEVLASMGPDAMKPFVNELIAGMVSQRVQTDQCARIDRVLELLDPLPPENLARLVAFAYAEGREEQRRGAAAAR